MLKQTYRNVRGDHHTLSHDIEILTEVGENLYISMLAQYSALIAAGAGHRAVPATSGSR